MNTPRRKTRSPESNRPGKPHGSSPVLHPTHRKSCRLGSSGGSGSSNKSPRGTVFDSSAKRTNNGSLTCGRNWPKPVPITRTAKTLTEGLALARQASSDARSVQTAAQKLNDEVIRLKAALATANAEAVRAHKRRDTWTEQWSSAIAVLRLRDPSVSVKTVQDYLKRIAEMQQHLTDMRIKAARVREIAEERVLLLDRLTALRWRLDPTARPSTAETLNVDFREVDAALKAARVGRTQHEERAKQSRQVQAGHRHNQRRVARSRSCPPSPRCASRSRGYR